MSPPRLVQHGLERKAREAGGKPCLLAGGSTLSFAEVDGLAERFARCLRERGVALGDRVALLLGNSPRYVAALYGTLKAGAVAVPLDPTAGASSWREVATRCDPALVVTDERLAPALAASLLSRRLPCLTLTDVSVDRARPHLASPFPNPPPPRGRNPLPSPDSGDEHRDPLHSLRAESPSRRHADEPLDLSAFPPDPRPAGTGSHDPAVILFTSGSTGIPKGVVLTHRNIVANTLAVLDYLRLSPDDRGLAVLPFHYVYGQSVLLTHLWAGASLAIENRAAYPQVVLQEMARLGVSGLSGVPSTFMVMLQKGDFAGLELPRLRYLTCAGGHLPDLHVRGLGRRFPGADIYLMYGATEAAGRISYLPPALMPRKRGSIGVPIQGVEMRVVDGGRPAGPFEEGEIEARGETFSPGYWPLADPADRLPADGWYRTGDLGYRDDDGCFFLTGRASDLIKIAGHRVSGAEVERALYETGLVHECAVAGRPDDVLGERAEAWVVPARPGVSVAEILAALAARLPAWKRPARIHLQEALEKSASGKILKGALR